MNRRTDPERHLSRGLLWIAAAWAGLLMVIALLVPYHGTDALVYGTWSERIADLGTLRTPDAGNALLHRPLFYGGQGLLWGIFGIHEWIGRLWSWLFLAVFLASLARLASGRRRDLLSAGLATVLVLAVPDVAVQAAAGQTDVPVAALVTLAAAIVWTIRPGPARTIALVAVVAAASLTKPSAVPAIAGLAAATLIGRQATLSVRLRWDLGPIVAGVALALVYHIIQSRYLGQSLYDFLAGATEDPAAVQAVNTSVADTYAEARRTIVVAARWLGPYVALLGLFAGLYALARVAGAAHRLSATVALIVSVPLAWLAPYIAQDGPRTVRVGPLEAGQPGATLAFLLLLVALWLSRGVPSDQAPSRTFLARMLVWSAPMILAWIQLNPSETRYLSAAWAPLVLLMTSVLAGIVRSVAARGWAWPMAIGAIPVVLLALNLRNVDSLGTRPDGTHSLGRALADLRPGDLLHPERMRAIADPQLAGLRADALRAVGDNGRLLADDGRMTFFFRDRLTVRTPTGCADAVGYAGVALLGNLATPPLDLTGCRAPTITVVRAVPGSYTVYAVR
ncbi:MAG: hypothetical protein IRZ32_17765 [Solirubrobacteraceae bacterium]|nr:hypothetical protein [Solirubrobacteraceae bacterium]